jgi:hypothetical protein
MPTAGVVDEDVNGVETGEQRFDLVVIAHVTDVAFCRATSLAVEFRDCFRDFVLITCGDDHTPYCVHERFGNSATDALGAAGDNCFLFERSIAISFVRQDLQD